MIQRALDFAYVRSLETLGALLYVKLNGVTFIQVSVPFTDDSLEVHKDILTRRCVK